MHLFLSFSTWVILNIIYIGLRKLLPDKLLNWWKYCFGGLQSVSCSSGVKTGHFHFKFWAEAWAVSFELLCVSFFSLELTLSCTSVFVVIVAVVNDWVIGAIVVNSRSILTAFSLFVLSFQVSTLTSVMSRLYMSVPCQFGSVDIRVLGTLAHSVHF